MSRVNQTGAPYYVRDTDKPYTQVLYRPGVALQNAELNESQLILKKIIKEVADTFLTDGDIREGVQLIVNDNNTVTVTAGKIYMEGAVHEFKEQTVEIEGAGIETIGVKINQEAVTSREDNNLVSRASGMPAYNLPGADRLKEELILVANDKDASLLYTLEDGRLMEEVKNEDNNFIKQLEEILARRTYDESGHYKVWGMELSQKNQYDDENLYLSLSEGKAYVEGWEILKTSATTIPIKRSFTNREIANEPKFYTTETGLYKLNNYPANTVNSVMGLIEVNSKMTRQGAVNGTDPIPSKYTPVVDIKKITDETRAKTYRKGTDYTLEGDTVRWLSGGEQPSLGSSYEITFTYNKELVEGVDYNFITENDEYFIEILEEGDKPVNQSQMLIDYDFTLHQINTITLDKNGKIHVIEGQFDTVDKVAPADITDQDVLVLGYVTVIPKNDNLIIENSMNIRSEMTRIQSMYERISRMETNIAITDLEKEAIEGSQATELKGVFTDGFLGWSKSDINHDQYTASIDPYLHNLLIGYNAEIKELSIDKQKSKNIKEYGRIATAAGRAKKTDSQPLATQSHLINPYTVFKDKPHLTITPAVDNWVDTKKVTIQREGGTNVVRNRINETRKETIDKRGAERKWWASTDSSSTSYSTAKTGSTSRSATSYATSSATTDTAIEYMRERTIRLKASKFKPYEQDIKVSFNDVVVEATVAGVGKQGAKGTLIADQDGFVEATFKVPAGTRCGTVNVNIWSENEPKLIGQTSYTSNGTLRTTTTTITRNTTVYVTDIYTTTETTTLTRTFRYVDPVSQTFELPEDQQLTSVGIYLSAVDPEYPVTVQIRETDNAYPADVILAEKVLRPSELKGSSNSQVETKVEFDNPVYCKANTQYAITILSESPKASLWIQELGKRDINSNLIVARNPYIAGVMFTSSNALTWTAHQTKNIKFNLYAVEYESTAQAYFNPIKGIDYDRIQLMADTSVPKGTKLEWEYSKDGEESWLPLAINTTLDLDRAIDSITVRVNLTTNGKCSPAFATDSLILVGYKNDEESSYISRNIQLEKEFTNVTVIADVHSPSGTGVTFYYATDINGNTWKPLSQKGEGLVKVDGGLTEYTYSAEGIASAKNFRVKIEMKSNNPTLQPAVRNLKCIMN